MEGDMTDELLAQALRPYLEAFDEAARSALAGRLQNHSINLVASHVIGERHAGPVLSFSMNNLSRTSTPKTRATPDLDTSRSLTLASQSNSSIQTPISAESWQQMINVDLDVMLGLQQAQGIEGIPSACESASYALPGNEYAGLDFGWDQNQLDNSNGLTFSTWGIEANNQIYASPQTQNAVQVQPSDKSSKPKKKRRRQSPAQTKQSTTVAKARINESQVQSSCVFEGQNEQYASMTTARFGRGTNYALSDEDLSQVMELSEDFLRGDLLEFLCDSLPRWRTSGIWSKEAPPGLLDIGTGHEKLFNAYRCICTLDANIGDDHIRNRIAVIALHSAYQQACQEWRISGIGAAAGNKTRAPAKRGRGDASWVIDDILARLHKDWKTNNGRKTQLRSRFHDKKRYGKRWLILTQALGDSVLIACSPKIVSAVQNTVFTTGMLEAVGYCVRTFHHNTCRILEALAPTAKAVLNGHRISDIDTEPLLRDLQVPLPCAVPEQIQRPYQGMLESGHPFPLPFAY